MISDFGFSISDFFGGLHRLIFDCADFYRGIDCFMISKITLRFKIPVFMQMAGNALHLHRSQ
ncbi:hypothetical protein HYN43_013570 [Mucilaginibacter celer]|uniref:Uncharacterized protein n=1 Tax=Mucilaginibacter celer TaxID=2305508 RepID=A0A494VY63_9SPHI|nr:hypothetical protein HYN43_013570 [Mucilaginibacter celer]